MFPEGSHSQVLMDQEMPAQDDALEEHFRRSLGPSYVDPTKANASHDTPEKKDAHSVDDHFARALGDKIWTELKAKKDPPEVLPDSVDEHFAKALGASTWKKLRGETVEQQHPQKPKEQHQQQKQSSATPASPPNSSLNRPLAI